VKLEKLEVDEGTEETVQEKEVDSTCDRISWKAVKSIRIKFLTSKSLNIVK